MTKFLSILCVTLMALSSTPVGAAEPVSMRDPSRTWMQRQWEIRYLLFVYDRLAMQIAMKRAREQNALSEPPGKESVYSDVEEFFEPTEFPYGPIYNKLATALIAFDPSGRVIGPNQKLLPFTAKRNLLDHLVLIRGLPGERPYLLADWDQGIPGDLSFSPAVCNRLDPQRYQDDWVRDKDFDGNFGCREWTAQLYDRSRPYIDVTTYSYGRGRNYIGEFVGWSRFTDPAKPVIGKQGKIWLCLHECPAGERPGPIGNIKAWTGKHGFPMPKRPPRQPLYPNANYLDDIRESDH